MIPYGKQSIDDADIQAVIEVLKSDWLTQGPTIPAFEAALARYCGAEFATAVSNATAALHISCLALGLGPGDRLWTSPNTFLASANCGLYCGAMVDFVDIDPQTYNMCPDKLEEKLRLANKTNTLPKIIVPVHFAGQSCDMQKIKALADRYDIKIIEDASHAVGGSYLTSKVGSCQYSDLTVFSFHPVKIITSAEGGMILTQSPELKKKLDILRCHGMTRQPEDLREPSPGAWYYEQIALGFNYRMTDLQAALGLSQLQRIDTFVSKRHALAARYHHELSSLPITLPYQTKDSYSAYHLFPVRIHNVSREDARKKVFDAMRAAGIGVNVLYIPVHTQPYYRDLGFKWGDFPESEAYYRESLVLPMFYSLTEAEQQYVIESLTHCLQDVDVECSKTPC